MSKSLIINADDFGLTRGINRAVRELHTAGALTSATLMANGNAFADAVQTAHDLPGLGIGCHIVLTDGVPVSHPESIPSLIGSDGKSFRASVYEFWIAALRGKIDEEEIAREALAQIQRLQREGIDVTHLDTHKHTHILPAVARPLLYAAERAGVAAIRNPFEQPWSLALNKSGMVRRLQVKTTGVLQKRFQAINQIRSGAIVTTDGTIGISATGHLNQATLDAILNALPEGVWELVCHPGYNDHELDAVTTRLRATREIERQALTNALSANLTHPLPAELIHYGKLGRAGVLRELGQFVPATGHKTIP